ncbi:MAG: hypothetical protein CMM77_08270 [Rhodospirillaceae bacterium]|nr:hypothetical protein [Rhodospirillaceae bacterium]
MGPRRRPGKGQKPLGLLGLLSYLPTHIKSMGGIGVNMLVTCPNCRTRYMLQPAQLGQGRNVRCSNCSNVWFADPREALPDPQPDPPRAAAPAGYPPHQQMYAQPGHGAAPAPYPPQGYAPAQPPAPQAAPSPPPPPAPEPAPMPPPPAPEPADEPDPIIEPDNLIEDAQDDNDMGVLPNDIDAMFEDDDDDIEPFESLINNDDEEDDLDSIESPDQMDDSDYIPDVFTAEEQDPDDDLPKKSILGKVIAVFFVLLIGGLLAGTFFFKDELVAKVPQLDDVFKMVGFHQVGDGLQIQRVEHAQETDKGLEVLVIRGQIENVADGTRPVPMMRAILFDSEGETIQHVDAAPLKSELGKGKTMSFKIRIHEPSPLRRRIKVIFIDPKDAAAAPQH